MTDSEGRGERKKTQGYRSGVKEGEGNGILRVYEVHEKERTKQTLTFLFFLLNRKGYEKEEGVSRVARREEDFICSTNCKGSSNSFTSRKKK